MENLELTEFDAVVSSHQLQMLKAAIPYISASQQQVLSIYVKIMELTNTFQLVQKKEVQSLGICSVSSQKKNVSEMLNSMKRFCTDEEKEMIDLLFNFLSAFRIYNSYKEIVPQENGKKEGGPMDAIKNMLSPEQKNMFDTYSSILSSANVNS